MSDEPRAEAARTPGRARGSASTSGSRAPTSARARARAVFAPLVNAVERIPPCGLLALAVGATALVPFISELGLRDPRRRQHRPLRAARARPERRRRLGGPARPRLHRLLRLRRLPLRDALLADQFGLHWPALLSIPIVIVSSALLGLLLGLPSRRLLGDYLAIVTLFFAQIFVVLATNADRITLPWNDGPTNFTGGPNGITDIDPISILGYEFGSTRSYLWLSLGVFARRGRRAAASSTSRAPVAPGGRCARTRSRPS